MQPRVIVLNLDEDDYNSIQEAIAKRQAYGRNLPDSNGQKIMPDGDSNIAGAVLAEICRGWIELLDSARG